MTRGIFFEMLGIEVKSVERVHRLSFKKPNRDRPVILRFYKFTENILVLQNSNKLKNTAISISEDYSKSARETRKKLWQASALNRSNGA